MSLEASSWPRIVAGLREPGEAARAALAAPLAAARLSAMARDRRRDALMRVSDPLRTHTRASFGSLRRAQDVMDEAQALGAWLPLPPAPPGPWKGQDELSLIAWVVARWWAPLLVSSEPTGAWLRGPWNTDASRTERVLSWWAQELRHADRHR